MANNYLGVDDLGMGRHMTHCTDELFRAVGRVAVIGAIIEMRMGYIVDQWGQDPTDRGNFMVGLVERFKEVKRSFVKANISMPPGLVEIVAEAREVMNLRNAAVHAIRPNDDYAWSSQPLADDDEEPHVPVLAEMRTLIERMSHVSDELGRYVWSPVDRPVDDRKLCACGCGELTRSRWLPNHRAGSDRRADQPLVRQGRLGVPGVGRSAGRERSRGDSRPSGEVHHASRPIRRKQLARSRRSRERCQRRFR